jgi:5-methylcytosine-specific restriction endonuclease McrA
MTLRRYAPMKSSRGTVIPGDVRVVVLTRDQGCVGPRVGMPGDCGGSLELDHVRASHGMGMKSSTEPGNLVALCGSHHRWKTSNGRAARPILLAYLEAHDLHAGHVDPCNSTCPAGRSRP